MPDEAPVQDQPLIRQVGSVELHVPSAWQVLVVEPIRSYPVSHVYCAICKYVVPEVVSTSPSVGELNAPQSEKRN